LLFKAAKLKKKVETPKKTAKIMLNILFNQNKIVILQAVTDKLY